MATPVFDVDKCDVPTIDPIPDDPYLLDDTLEEPPDELLDCADPAIDLNYPYGMALPDPGPTPSVRKFLRDDQTFAPVRLSLTAPDVLVDGDIWISGGDIFAVIDGQTTNIANLATPCCCTPTCSTLPDNDDFEWVNQGDASVEVNENDTLTLHAETGSVTESLHIRKQAIAFEAFRVTVKVIPTLGIDAGEPLFGMVLRESSSGKLHVFGLKLRAGGEVDLNNDAAFSPVVMFSEKWDGEETFNEEYVGETGTGLSQMTPIYLRMEDDGTDRICYYSGDGMHFIEFDRQSRSDFLEADEAGFFLDASESIGAHLTLCCWDVEELPPPPQPTHLLVGDRLQSGAPGLLLYEWLPGFGSQVAITETHADRTFAIEIFDDDIVVGGNNTGRLIKVYPWTGTNLGPAYTAPAVPPAGLTLGVSFTPSGRAVACAHDKSPYVTAWPWDSGFGTKYADPSPLPGGGGDPFNQRQARDIRFHPDGTYVAITTFLGFGAPPITELSLQVYAWDDVTGFGAKVDDPADEVDPGVTLGTSTGAIGCAWSPDGNYLAVCIGTSPYIRVYEWTGSGFGSVVADPAVLPAGFGEFVSWNKAGTLIAVTHSGSPFISVYEWTGSGFGAKLADAATLLPGLAVRFKWTSDEAYLAIAHSTSPFVSVYEWSSDGFGDKLDNPADLPPSSCGDVLWLY